jgi:hypothetical protein
VPAHQKLFSRLASFFCILHAGGPHNGEEHHDHGRLPFCRVTSCPADTVGISSVFQPRTGLVSWHYDVCHPRTPRGHGAKCPAHALFRKSEGKENNADGGARCRGRPQIQGSIQLFHRDLPALLFLRICKGGIFLRRLSAGHISLRNSSENDGVIGGGVPGHNSTATREQSVVAAALRCSCLLASDRSLL